MRLLDAGVHEDGTAAAQIHRAFGKQAQPGKLLHLIAQRLGKGLQEAAAAGGTGLVQEDIADRAVLDLETLHVLSADVDDKIHIRQEVFGRSEVRHGLHHAEVGMEGVFRQLLAIACRGHGGDAHMRMFRIEPLQHAADQRHRVAEVRPVIREQQLRLLVDDGELDRGGAGVDANVHRAVVVLRKRCARHGAFGVARAERLILRLACKQRRLGAIGLGHALLRHLIGYGAQVEHLVRVERGAERHVKKAVFRADAPDVQRAVKALPQHTGEGQGTAEIKHIAADRPTLGQARNGLVDHRLVDAGGDILRAAALVDQGLYVTLGKHTAAGGDRIGFGRVLRGAIHLVRAHFQQRRHLIDERTRAAGTGAVHANLHPVGEEQDLGVLAAELDDHVRPRGKAVGRHARGEHLLHEGHAHALRHAHAGRAGDGKHRPAAGHIAPRDLAQQLFRLFQDMTVVPLVGVKN